MNFKELKEKYDIRIVHLRWAYLDDGTITLTTRGVIECRGAFNRGQGYYSGSVLPNGGETIVRLKHEGKTYTGVAQCSNKDNYSRKEGRSIALERALEKILNNDPDEKVLEIKECCSHEKVDCCKNDCVTLEVNELNE